jgi:pyruvate formate lyase activating enzyme
MKALYYHPEDDKVRCLLCPHRCLIADGETGICRVRRNVSQQLETENYGKLSAIHLDPIEKKPLYHYHPGSRILSVGSVGCNLQCTFCQNCEISQTSIREYSWIKDFPVKHLLKEAQTSKTNLGIAFTYNEPTVFYEYMLDVAKLIASEGLKNVMVTNGFIETKPLAELLPYMHAFNVDLKAFNDDFYRKQTHSKLSPVKQTLLQLRKANKHLEITNLVIPELNDNDDEFETMIDWIRDELGKETILHLSKYFPRYRLATPSTPESTLLRLYQKASARLDYVYLGNADNQPFGNDTSCAKCKTVVIRRSGYQVDTSGINGEGACLTCGELVVKR